MLLGFTTSLSPVPSTHVLDAPSSVVDVPAPVAVLVLDGVGGENPEQRARFEAIKEPDIGSFPTKA